MLRDALLNSLAGVGEVEGVVGRKKWTSFRELQLPPRVPKPSAPGDPKPGYSPRSTVNSPGNSPGNPDFHLNDYAGAKVALDRCDQLWGNATPPGEYDGDHNLDHLRITGDNLATIKEALRSDEAKNYEIATIDGASLGETVCEVLCKY